ncbi:MAG: NAD-binding protein [Actinomycetota bacterium]
MGSGVTGVEFVHMFSSFGADVTLVVSRQQVLPGKDAEAAAALEDRFLDRGVRLLKGARAQSIVREGDEVVVSCDDGRTVRAWPIACSAILRPCMDATDDNGSFPLTSPAA